MIQHSEGGPRSPESRGDSLGESIENGEDIDLVQEHLNPDEPSRPVPRSTVHETDRLSLVRRLIRRHGGRQKRQQG